MTLPSDWILVSESSVQIWWLYSISNSFNSISYIIMLNVVTNNIISKTVNSTQTTKSPFSPNKL